MRFLVTGALGAIGVWTMRSLLERGHDVVALDLGGDGHRIPLALDAGQAAAVVHVQADITDAEALERVVDEHGITNVIHLAALQVPFVRADPALGARVNVTGTVNVLEAVRRRADRMGHLVYASSVAVRGAAGTLAAGDHPGTLYGVFKRANESTAVRYFEDFGVSSVGLRPHTVYGPARDQGLTSAPTVAMLAAAARVPARIPFGGSATLQYAPDVGEAFARAALADHDGAAVHDLDGPVTSMGDLAALVERTVPGARVDVEGDPLPFPAEVDGEGVVALLGGSAMRPLEDGVTDAIARFERLLAEGLVQPPQSN
jgi:UDP-glucuronate 4-epimerase